MKIYLNDGEIRAALAESMAKKLNHIITPDPDECWFEAEADTIDGGSVEDIHNVQFCYDNSK